MLLWCLDLWYETTQWGTDMHLYCIDEDGKRIEIVDGTVMPRFIAKGFVDGYLASSVQGYMGHNYVSKLESGKPRLCTEIFTKYPFNVSQSKFDKRGARYDIERLGVETAAADIFFDDVYKVAKGILPCSWFEFNPETKSMKMVDRTSAPPLPQLRKFVFDIEDYNPEGSPRPDVDPIVCIGIRTDDFSKMLLADEHDDKQLLADFIKILVDYNPDVVSHYFGNGSDIPYISGRCYAHSVPFIIGRDWSYSEPFESQRDTWSVKGRANIDLFDYARNYVRGAASLAQNDVYENVFGVRSEYNIDRSKVWELWDNNQREEVIRHCEADVDQTYDLLKYSLGFGIALSRMSSIPLDQVFTLTTGRRIEQALMRYANSYGELIPNVPRLGVHQRYLGAMTFPPLVGLHEDVYYLDFSGMYPTAASKFNTSFDTISPDGSIVIELEDTGEIIRYLDASVKPGCFANMMDDFLTIRRELKASGVTDKSMDFAVKTLCAASTGYFGWAQARWYSRDVIRTIINQTRAAERESKRIVDEMGWVFVYGDTDSTFVKDPTHTKDIDSLISAISDRVGMQIKVDDHFVRVGFGDAKKHYWGLTDDGRLIIRGMEAIRGEWCPAAKEAQRHIIDLVLRDGDVKGAVAYSRNIIDKFNRFEFSMEDVTIRKGLGQEIEDYDSKGAHVVVAERMGIDVGNKVEYVITRAFGKKRTLADKAKSPTEVRSLREIDVNYYINKQLVPVLGRILDVVLYRKPKTLGEIM